MSRFLAVGLVLLSAGAGGCTHNPHAHGGPLIAEYHPGGPVATAQTPYRASYGLYQCSAQQAGNPERPAEQPLLWRGLHEEEAIGFTRSPEGALLAVAGPDQTPLAEGRYCWHITPETELHGTDLVLHETGKTLTRVGRFTGGVALGVLLMPIVILYQIPVSPFPF